MRLDVVTPKGTLLSAEVDEVTAPGVLGEFGVLPGHVPFLTGIRAGVLHLHGPAGAGVYALGTGYAEVANDRIVILVGEGVRADQIDAPAAEREVKELQAKLDHFESEDHGARLELEARRNYAQARLDAAGTPATTH